MATIIYEKYKPQKPQTAESYVKVIQQRGVIRIKNYFSIEER